MIQRLLFFPNRTSWDPPRDSHMPILVTCKLLLGDAKWWGPLLLLTFDPTTLWPADLDDIDRWPHLNGRCLMGICHVGPNITSNDSLTRRLPPVSSQSWIRPILQGLGADVVVVGDINVVVWTGKTGLTEPVSFSTYIYIYEKPSFRDVSIFQI